MEKICQYAPFLNEDKPSQCHPGTRLVLEHLPFLWWKIESYLNQLPLAGAVPVSGCTRWCPPSYKFVISTWTIDISPINHSYIGVVFTNLAIERRHHLVQICITKELQPGPHLPTSGAPTSAQTAILSGSLWSSNISNVAMEHYQF